MWALICLTAAALGVARASIIVYTQDLPHSIAEEFRDLPASFGPELPTDGLRGFLVSGQPESGCGPLAKPPTADNFTGKWIVLVARYNCSFEEKVRNAQLAGYDCVIVHNVNSSDLETMSAKDPEGIVIPSVFVSDVAGIIIAENYNYTTGYYIMVNGDLPFNINTNLLLPFAIVVVLCLLVILTFMIVKCIRDRNRARRHRLPNRSLKKIPTCKFSKGDPYDTCAICLDDYVEGDKLRVLPCAHAYHMKCVDPWLTQNRRVCPVCKRRVMAAGERVPPRAPSDSDTDDDTAPLISADPGDVTQGGTFDEQSENPFRRAQRFMLRLHASGATRNALARRLGRGDASRGAPPAPENDESNNDNDNDNGGTGRAGAAAATSVSTHSERTPPHSSSSSRSARRTRRARRSHSAGAGAAGGAPRGSVNADAQPHIGVAALPASNDLHPPHIINL